jgi:hypothetical protein
MTEIKLVVVVDVRADHTWSENQAADLLNKIFAAMAGFTALAAPEIAVDILHHRVLTLSEASKLLCGGGQEGES